MMTLLGQAVVDLGSSGGQSAGSGKTTFDFSRLHDFDDPRLFWLVFGAAVALLALFAWRVYRRDAVELSLPSGAVLLGLRLVAICAAAWFFLGLEKRTDVEVSEHSQVMLLVDSSLSMGLRDTDTTGIPAGPSRGEQVVDALTKSDLIDRLREQHDVQIGRFDERFERVARLEQYSDGAADDAPPDGSQSEFRGEGTDDGADPQAGSGETGEEGGDHSPEWPNQLEAQGLATHLGDSLRTVVSAAARSPLAGVVVFSDGGQNAGIAPDTAIELAQKHGVPIHTVGIGSTQPRRNVRVSEVVAPKRAYPADSMTITGHIHSQGYANRSVDVHLYQRQADENEAAEQRIASNPVLLGADSGSTVIEFELKPKQAGKFVYRVAISPPVGDVDPNDDSYQVDIDVVDEELEVLLFAGGPSREYRFLRNMLHRDPGVNVDVLLQSAKPGISQDAREVLDDFPVNKQELYTYDAIVAFDPDWRMLDAAQLELLQDWVSEEAGGLIIAAGPVYTGNWLDSPEHTALVAMYPVEFRKRLALLGDARFGSTTPWPIELSRDGLAADFLQLEKAPNAGDTAWKEFEGVYGYFAVKGAKPTATTYAFSSDPAGGTGDRRRPFFVGQFYGAGRTFYLGSGEMWRLRALGESYFEVFYTKLLRHVTEGRLLKGSAHGLLLVERDRYLLGDTVTIRAQLSDEQYAPLRLPSVQANIARPDKTYETVTLKALDEQPGGYLGQLRVLQEGAYQVELPLPTADEVPLSKRIHVRVPDLERERPELNVALLSHISGRTGGNYYPSLATAVEGSANVKPLYDVIDSKAEVRILRGAPDEEFSRKQSLWILGIFCGALSLEWLLRRLLKLA